MFWQGLTDIDYYLTILKARSLRSRVQQCWFLLRPLSLAWRWLSFPCFSYGVPCVHVCVLISSLEGHPSCWIRPTLTWKTSWMEEPGRLQSMGSLRVWHDWASSLWLFTFMHWRRKWHPTPVFLPGESQGRGSLVGCHLWGRTESDTTEAT